jgi:hypothetical protein
MCPPFGLEGSVDVHFTVAILSKNLLEMLNFSVKAFCIKNDLGSSDKFRKSSTVL